MRVDDVLKVHGIGKGKYKKGSLLPISDTKEKVAPHKLYLEGNATPSDFYVIGENEEYIFLRNTVGTNNTLAFFSREQSKVVNSIPSFPNGMNYAVPVGSFLYCFYLNGFAKVDIETQTKIFQKSTTSFSTSPEHGEVAHYVDDENIYVFYGRSGIMKVNITTDEYAKILNISSSTENQVVYYDGYFYLIMGNNTMISKIDYTTGTTIEEISTTMSGMYGAKICPKNRLTYYYTAINSYRYIKCCNWDRELVWEISTSIFNTTPKFSVLSDGVFLTNSLVWSPESLSLNRHSSSKIGIDGTPLYTSTIFPYQVFNTYGKPNILGTVGVNYSYTGLKVQLMQIFESITIN